MNALRWCGGSLALVLVGCGGSAETPPRSAELSASSSVPARSAEVLAPQPAGSASALPTSSPALAAPTVRWRALSRSETESKSLEATLAFQTDGNHGYWVADGKLFARPLSGGKARVIQTSLEVRDLLALRGHDALVASSEKPRTKVAAWLVALDDGSPPRSGGEWGNDYAREGDTLWVAGLDAIWAFDAPDHKVKSHANHDGFSVDADAFYFRDESRNVVAVDRKRGTPKILAKEAWSDIALDGDGVLWIKPDPELPEEHSTPSHRTIERTPKSGGAAHAVTSAEEPCGLWVVGDDVVFFAQGPAYQTAALYRAPRKGAKEPEKIGDTARVATFFGCRSAASLVGHVLYWASASGWLFRSDLGSAHPSIEALPPEPAD